MIKSIYFPAPVADEMIRAIQAGTKTVTRRVVKPQPREIYHGGTLWEDGRDLIALVESQNGRLEQVVSPYRPGNALYVRETFQVDYLSNIPGTGRIHYKADDAYADFSFSPRRYDMMRRAQLKPGWRPNENMPREAARIFLRVTDVRVERLQEITEEQAKAEGYEAYGPEQDNGYWEPAVLGFVEDWNSTIKPADRARYGWDANPWVWVIEFERISREEVTCGAVSNNL